MGNDYILMIVFNMLYMQNENENTRKGRLSA